MPLGELSKYIDTEIERLEAGQARGTLETESFLHTNGSGRNAYKQVGGSGGYGSTSAGAGAGLCSSLAGSCGNVGQTCAKFVKTKGFRYLLYLLAFVLVLFILSRAFSPLPQDDYDDYSIATDGSGNGDKSGANGGGSAGVDTSKTSDDTPSTDSNGDPGGTSKPGNTDANGKDKEANDSGTEASETPSSSSSKSDTEGQGKGNGQNNNNNNNNNNNGGGGGGGGGDDNAQEKESDDKGDSGKETKDNTDDTVGPNPTESSSDEDAGDTTKSEDDTSSPKDSNNVGDGDDETAEESDASDKETGDESENGSGDAGDEKAKSESETETDENASAGNGDDEDGNNDKTGEASGTQNGGDGDTTKETLPTPPPMGGGAGDAASNSATTTPEVPGIVALKPYSKKLALGSSATTKDTTVTINGSWESTANALHLALVFEQEGGGPVMRDYCTSTVDWIDSAVNAHLQTISDRSDDFHWLGMAFDDCDVVPGNHNNTLLVAWFTPNETQSGVFMLTQNDEMSYVTSRCEVGSAEQSELPCLREGLVNINFSANMVRAHFDVDVGKSRQLWVPKPDSCGEHWFYKSNMGHDVCGEMNLRLLQ